ncbi:uncharacterized protein VTP21DRAFT_10017 [Calcarisporiella thermophila]|uniref:uncharacterized protein n=1 Tax=Calcarisporiella thermophila TaxID=911321 RepID=UPI00374432F4
MTLFACGSNGNGQLGVGHEDDISFFAPCLFTHPLPSHTPPQFVTGGGNHAALVTSSGELWLSGLNSDGQSSASSSEDEGWTSFRPSTIPGSTRVKTVCCGWTTTFVITEQDGLVYAMGKGSSGELGLGQVVKSSKPALIEALRDVVDIRCGLRHVVALTRDGSLWGWGSERHGALSNSKETYTNKSNAKKSTRWRPEPVQIDARAVAIACGLYFTAILDDQGRVWTMGLNKHGQLGRADPKDLISTSKPMIVSLPTKVVQLSCGWNHTVVLCEDGGVYAWGRNDHGQLGIRGPNEIGTSADGWYSEPMSIAYLPQQISLTNISRIACGSEHTLAVTSDKKLLTWGWNEHGNCATRDRCNVLEPRLIDGVENVAGVGAGCGTSWVWTQGAR